MGIVICENCEDMKKLKKIIETIKNIDGRLKKYFVYEIVFALAFLVMFVAFFDCFSANKVFMNYDPEKNSTVQVSAGTSFSQSFEAQGSTLKSLRLMINPSKTKLKTSDKINVVISDSEGNVLMDGHYFLYNSTRAYVPIDCDNLDLDKGEKYTIKINLDDVDKKSVLSLRVHQQSSLNLDNADIPYEDITMDEETDEIYPQIILDEANGYQKLINITYYYKTTDYVYTIIHLVVYTLFVAFAFMRKPLQNRLIAEIYKGFGIALILYLFAEILNVKSHRGIRIFAPFTLKHWFVLLSAFIIVIAFYFLIYMVTSSSTIAAIATAVCCALIAYTNHAKLVMRGDSFMPWDLFSAGIAVKTGSTYYFHVTLNFVVSIVLLVAFACFVRITYLSRYKYNREHFAMIAFSVTFFAMAALGLVFNQKVLNKLNIYYEVNPPIQSYNENGTYMAFLYHLNNLGANGSDLNSPEATLNLEYQYEAKVHEMGIDAKVNTSNVKPNVICIMSEAYCDLDNIRELDTSEPVTPFFDELCANTRNGELAVSIFGGGTCNTEFEFLTGYSMSSLLPGSSVYTFYVNSEIEALPHLFRDNGYRTVALHSFDGDWWDRREKYPLLGFDEFYTRDDFDPDTTSYVRRYISDMDTFHKITDIYDETEDPLFLFCVTMQNHADFSMKYDNMKYDIKLNNVLNQDGEHFEYAENYLSLLRESDDALRYLIEYLENCDEPTIVVFFGDHYPTLDTEFYDAFLTTEIGSITIDESLPLYSTSYFVWANYDIGDSLGEDGIISPNFLGQDILDMAGIKSPASRACLRVLHENISAISALAVYDENGVPYKYSEELPEHLQKLIDDYSFIQYGLIYYNDDDD